jgi:type II secretory pathway component PulF
MHPRSRNCAANSWSVPVGVRPSPIIADIAAANPKLTQPFEAALLGFGEEAGSFETTLETLAAHFTMEHKLLNKVWAQLTYPLITSFVAIVIAPLPVLVFGNAGAYAVTVAIGLFAWYSFGGGVVTGFAAQYANRREFVLARLARGLAGAVEAGLPLDRAVALAAESTGHPDIIAHVRRLSQRDQATRPASETFAGCPVVPGEMIAAMKVAEVSGDFTGSLRKMAELYDGI